MGRPPNPKTVTAAPIAEIAPLRPELLEPPAKKICSRCLKRNAVPDGFLCRECLKTSHHLWAKK